MQMVTKGERYAFQEMNATKSLLLILEKMVFAATREQDL